MPWWLFVIMPVMWLWALLQTYRAVRCGTVRAAYSDVSGKYNPLFWFYAFAYAFGVLFLPVMFVYMLAQPADFWPQ